MNPNPKLSRTRIEEAAIEVFDLVGFHGAAARTVARRYEGAPGSIYYYFSSMEDLYVKSCLPRFQEAMAFLTEPLASECETLFRLCGAVSEAVARLDLLPGPLAACLRIGFHELFRRDEGNQFRDIVRQRDRDMGDRIRTLAKKTGSIHGDGADHVEILGKTGVAAELLTMAFRRALYCFAAGSSVPAGFSSQAGLFCLISGGNGGHMPGLDETFRNGISSFAASAGSTGASLFDTPLSLRKKSEDQTTDHAAFAGRAKKQLNRDSQRDETKDVISKSKPVKLEISEPEYPEVLARLVPKRQKLSEELL